MKTVLILSGGMDSATLAHEPGLGPLLCLSFDYGQRHVRELTAAAAIAAAVGAEHRILRLDGFAAACPGSSLTDPAVAVPHGHYAAETMKATVVSSRNAILLATAFGVAVAHGAEQVATAVHAGDHTIYPDCREPFLVALEEALNLGVWSDRRIAIRAPYLALSKIDIARRGGELGVPFELTWTCYDPQGAVHCGQCGACEERKEAFRDAGLVDPTEYAA
ncbi:MAG: 7-cyano-7-deazaguanine synthase QueC [Gammaproteobacteria bacterium]|nr:7-cyano-7-deazaguanine synthase QueC [Gammaproteobacteria bacterium]